MKIARRAMAQEAEPLQLAPLIDIVFLTLVFFMTTTVYSSLETDLDIVLPTAKSGAVTDRSRGEIYINLRPDGTVTVNNRQLTMPELQDVLFRVAEYFPGGAVIIRGDRNALLGSAISILDSCKKADIQNVSFQAAKEDRSVKP